MAKIRYSPLVPDDMFVIQQFPDVVYGTKETKTRFELHDTEGNYANFVEVKGEGFTYRKGYLVDGTITDMTFRNGDGKAYMSVHGMHYEVNNKIDLAETSPTFFYIWALDGNDRVTGSKQGDVMLSGIGKNVMEGRGGNDTLLAGGKDVLTGGGGSDTFCFTGNENVVVTDFDATGGGTHQDYLYFSQAAFGKPRIYQDHHDTVLEFQGFFSVRLEDVDRSEVSIADDFKVPPVLDV